jgi:hypothetical protein
MEVMAMFIDSSAAAGCTVEAANEHLMPNSELSRRVVECSISKVVAVREKIHSNESARHWMTEGIHNSTGNDDAEEEEDVFGFVPVKRLDKFTGGGVVVGHCCCAVVFAKIVSCCGCWLLAIDPLRRCACQL